MEQFEDQNDTQNHKMEHNQSNKHLRNKQRAKTDKHYTKTQQKQVLAAIIGLNEPINSTK